MARTKQPRRPGRLPPPISLPAGAATMWRALVESLPEGHFEAQDEAHLEAYIFAAWRHRLEVKRSARKSATAVDAAVIRDTTGIMARLGPQLRLVPSARIDHKQASRAPAIAEQELRSEPEAAGDWRAALPDKLN